MPSIDVNQLIAAVTTQVNTVLQKDIATVQGFARDQLEGIANQAKIIAEAFASGASTEAQFKGDMDDLAKISRTFVKVMTGLLIIEVEKVWNAVVKVVWDAIDSAIGSAVKLPLPKL